MIWMEVDFTRQTIPTNTNTPNLSKIMATYMSHKMVVAIYIYILYIYIFCGNSPDWILATLDSWSGQGYPHEKDGTVYSGKVFANVPLCTTVSVGANTYIHYVDVVVFNILGGLADCNLTATNLAQMLRPAGFSRTSEALWLSAVTSEVDL